MKVKILYIDDEPNNLISFKASFRMHYQIFTATTAMEAVSVMIENKDIKVIFCDQRMPNVTGVDLLEQLKSLFPLPVRILITGYADIDAVIDAINKSNIFQYIKKPWKEEEVLNVIEEAVKHYNANSMLSVRNQELQTAYKELDKFAYSVSHDIRGPLAGILTGIDYLQYSDDINEVKELLSMMKKSLHQLDDYIIAMHQYYNQQKGQVVVADIDFKQLVQENQNIYSVFADANNIAFESNVVQNEVFKSDLVSLKLIVNNLLSNAFKYIKKDSSDKKVKLNIEVKSGLATITVEDNGVGMPEDVLDKIFELHFRSETKEAGFGFGLFNLKGALMKLNGQIDVQSAEGVGSAFKITIPGL
ncbi:MAG TPA: hybrid sensor histidine kinase/response regulator [Chitinophagaceae bacterium]|nr:hybrid sensor histidine kinase/response regulator [Chitinophagaceae bacterium]